MTIIYTTKVANAIIKVSASKTVIAITSVWFDGKQYSDTLPLNMTRHRHKALPELEKQPGQPTGLNFLEATKAALAKEQAERLRYTIENRYFSLVTGEIGASKSTAIRTLCQSMDSSKYRFVYLSESKMSPRIFYQHHILPVIVVDEGQELSTAMINEFRFVINFDVDSHSPLALTASRA